MAGIRIKCISASSMNRCVVHKVDGFHIGGSKDLDVGGWGPANPYRVRIVKSIRIIGPSLTVPKRYCMHLRHVSCIHIMLTPLRAAASIIVDIRSCKAST